MNVEAQIVAAKLVGYIEAKVSIGRVDGNKEYIPIAETPVQAKVYCTGSGLWVASVQEPVCHQDVFGLPITHYGIKLFDSWGVNALSDNMVTHPNGGNIVMHYKLIVALCP